MTEFCQQPGVFIIETVVTCERNPDDVAVLASIGPFNLATQQFNLFRRHQIVGDPSLEGVMQERQKSYDMRERCNLKAHDDSVRENGVDADRWRRDVFIRVSRPTMPHKQSIRTRSSTAV